MDASDDLIQPFMIELSGLRGRLIRMGPVVEDVISRHDLPEAIQGLMAEFVVLAVALSAALKFDGIFTLQAKGNGPIGLMAADVTSDGGVRAYDTSNPFQPQEIASFVPAAPEGAPTGAIQINDVYVDENAIVYAIDRHVGGLYVLEADI